ncbi:hypothetical protein ACHQM5_010487 [Ranunculus cassubicifolius]
MAESAVVSFVVEKLGDLLIGKAAFLHGVEDRVEEMKNELKWIQSFLKDAESKQEDRDERLRLWVSEIREIAYDIDDVIDSFVLKVQSQRRKSLIKRSLSVLQKYRNLRAIGKEIKSIQLRLRNISKNREKYNQIATVISATNENTTRWRRLLPHIKNEDSINFLEEDTVDLVSQLMKEEEQCRVISIIGMGGIGKTTLAFKLYNHPDVKNRFDCCVWVYVSKYYNLADILRTILVHFNGVNRHETFMEVFSVMNEEQLFEEIYIFLERKRYFVVLDDIWSMEAWDVLRPAFPNGMAGSKIMLTSRNSRVALHANSQTNPYEPRCLTEDESWVLFCRKAFPGANCPDNYVELGKQIVRKCAGLPLAVVVLAGLLLTKKSWDEWMEVNNNISWHLSKSQEDRVSKILALSYNDLPYHLKLCFLYFSHFPVDSYIRVKKLIRLWVAEGFIPQGGEETVEIAAESCLNELIARCMVQVVEMSYGNIKACQVHEVLRDFSVARSREENFLEILGGTDYSNEASSFKPRRQVIHSGYTISRYATLKSVARRIRSLLILQSDYQSLDYKHLNFMWKEFKQLRILDLGNSSIGDLPNDIGNLIHLRYLGLKGTHLKKVPKSIGNLGNLQTLDLRSSYLPIVYTSLELPDVIWKLEELRHLLLDTKYGKGLRIDTLKNLQTLLSIRYGGSIEQGLVNLTSLRKLGIYDISGREVNEVFGALVKFKFLRSLSLSLSSGETFQELSPLSDCLRLQKLYLWGRIEELPGSDVFPPNLIKLTLHVSRLEKDPMETLGKLPNLISLQLQYDAYKGKELLCTANSFPHLQILRLLGLYELEEWILMEGTMPALTHLEIWDCKYLNKLPGRLRSITSLQKLVIGYMPREFTSKVRAEGELQKIQHIPHVTIY